MRRVMRNSIYIIIPVFMALLFILVLYFNANAQTTAPTSTAASDSTASITGINLAVNPPTSPLVSPTPNTVYADVQVSLQVSGFNLVDKIGQTKVPGEGHIIYYLNNPPTFPFTEAYSAQGTYFKGSTSTNFIWTNYNLTLGGYWILAAQLVNNDDTPLNPPVYAEIVTNLATPGQPATKPAITSMVLTTSPPSSPLVSPAPDTIYFDTRIDCQIAGFNIVPNNSPDASDQGHPLYYSWVDPLIVPNQSAYVSGNNSFAGTANHFTWLDEIPQYQTYAMELVNSDDTPLNPPVYAMIKTNIALWMETPVPSPETTTAPTGTISATTSPLPPSTFTPSTSVSGQAIKVNLIAQNTAFNMASIVVPANARVTINFNNMDSGVAHNFSVYTDPSASTTIFKGDPVTGPATTTYTFTSPPTPDTYFYRCDIHPQQMFGTFVVTK
jgi:hypothetical protein